MIAWYSRARSSLSNSMSFVRETPLWLAAGSSLRAMASSWDWHMRHACRMLPLHLHRYTLERAEPATRRRGTGISVGRGCVQIECLEGLPADVRVLVFLSGFDDQGIARAELQGPAF